MMLKRVIEKNHYSPRAVDDSFSIQVFNRYIERLDDDKLILTKADVDQLFTYRLQIDDELMGKSWNFLPAISALYKARLLKADSMIRAITEKPFDFTIKEAFSLKADTQYAGSFPEYEHRWRKWLKYETMMKIYDINLASTKQPIAGNSFSKLEEEARIKVKNIELRRIRSVLDNPGGYENYMANLFCNIIASNFDPHTEFFSVGGREDFLNAIHSDGMYYGFSVGEDDKGSLEITNLIPGGPAWKTGELNKGDELLEFRFQNKSPIDLSGASAEEASGFLDLAGNEKLTLTVKKPSGLIKSVTLAKEKIKNDDHVVKSFILLAPKKIGYISLPGFYSDAEEDHISSCANDVAKAIINLKRDNIDGLVLDLRNNGGGSLKEALDMAGIFIDTGPLALYKERNGRPVTLKDMNQGTIYDGPLLVLQNTQTASASELLTATLQDYHRAIIAGSTSYGKGTAQAIFPLDTLFNPDADSDYNQKSDLGYVKITTGKFYRITGATTQQSGVNADVLIPDMLDQLKFREIDEPFSLAPDTVKRNTFYKPLAQLPIAALSSNSVLRVNASRNFETIKRYGKTLGAETDHPSTIPLQWDEFLQWTKNFRQMDPQDLEKSTFSPDDNFMVDNNSTEKNSLFPDNYDQELNANWKKRLSRDIYVSEAVQVLIDYINLTSKN
jgi:carboxyl-terminal processing protease